MSSSFTARPARRAVLAGALVLAAAAAVAPALAADGPRLAISGHDPVAYFTQGRPVAGSPAHAVEHEGAVYHFASAANRDAFVADPARYAPQYGGYCAFGAAMGRKFEVDPNAWRIVDGRLFLNLNTTVQRRWEEDVPGYIRGADHNWSIIASIPDSRLEAAPPAGLTIGPQ